ncbi:MAG: hypothetical protein NTY19_09765 [Planctomycetota bacterium]|nr:hypothetical protein [Planctomycetota bacterium]
MSTKQQLIDVLNQVGKPPRFYHSPDGTTVLILPYGGRVLGLFGPGSDENFYWTHAALESAESAARYYQGQQWQNSGGDRTWLAPEVDFFFPNFPQTDVYFQPRGLDPGNYQVVQDAAGEPLLSPRLPMEWEGEAPAEPPSGHGSAGASPSRCEFPLTAQDSLVNRATLVLSRSKAEVELEITKSIAPASNPLRYERGLTSLPIEYAGYTQHTSLRWLAGDGPAGTPIGLWNLLQMPHGGELLVPTYGKTEPRVIFGTIHPEDLSIGEHLFRYRMRAAGEQKLGIRAVAVAGRIGYLIRAHDGRWSLLIRSICVNPSGEYVDVPWRETEDRGYAVQACNIHNSELGSFSELEYHVPAIGFGTGRRFCEDISQVWAFRGGREAIECVVRSLLTSELTSER